MPSAIYTFHHSQVNNGVPYSTLFYISHIFPDISRVNIQHAACKREISFSAIVFHKVRRINWMTARFNFHRGLLSMSPRNGSCVAEVSSVRSLSSDDVSGTKANRKKSCWARATDPAHRRGRRIQLLQMLVLPFIPILALIVQTANTLHDILIYRQEVSDIESQVSKKSN